MNDQKNTSRFAHWVKTSTSLRMLAIGFLILILLIPLNFIKELIKERKQLQNQVVSEINKSWGEEITLYGPILKIPYAVYHETTLTDAKTKKVQKIREKETRYAYFFPNELAVSGTIATELKKRGIYSASVYNSETAIKGNFTQANFDFIGDIKDKNIQWNKSTIVFKTTNLKGVNNELSININTNILGFEAQFQNENFDNSHNTYTNQYRQASKHLIETPYFNSKELFQDGKIKYSMNYNASGSSRFQIIPIGKETKMNLTSNWKDASFKGEYLPYNPDKVTADGFDARWKVLQMNRPFPQNFRALPNLDNYAFGVDFFIPVNDYQQNERSAKYGYLMISLTFLLFFLIQTLSKVNIHPFQYLMIGLGLIIFYTLLISISEHSNFTKAYAIASAAVIILISLYSKSILKDWKFPVFIGISLTALYGFIFVIIQLENYALLVGSIGLFVILAAVMYASRKIEWG